MFIPRFLDPPRRVNSGTVSKFRLGQGIKVFTALSLALDDLERV